MTEEEKTEIPVLYRGGGIVICQKPVGVLSQSGKGEDIPLPELLRREFGGKAPAVITRLDRGVGGACVLASPEKAAAMTALLQDHERFSKEYLAIAPYREGEIEPEGRMVDLLYHDPVKNKTFPVKKMRRGVKEAILRYRRLDTKTVDGVCLSLVEVDPVTGRTHQIRAQFAARRMPVLGDRRYGGSPLKTENGGIALVCRSITVPPVGDSPETTVQFSPVGIPWEWFC